MLFRIEGKRNFLMTIYQELTLRAYKGKAASADIFSEFETDVPKFYKQEESTGAYLISERSFLKLALYWSDEVDNFNNDCVSSEFGDRLAQKDIDRYELQVLAYWCV